MYSISHHGVIGTEASAPEFRGGRLTPAFASDLRSEIRSWGPDLWISGHTHHSYDLMVGETRCLAAQRGYVGTEKGAAAFVPKVIEV